MFRVPKLALHVTKTSQCAKPIDPTRDCFEFILASGLHQKPTRSRFDASCPATFVTVSIHIFLVSSQHRWSRRVGILQMAPNECWLQEGRQTSSPPKYRTGALQLPSISPLMLQPSSRLPCWDSLLSHRIARLDNSSATCHFSQGV